MRIVLEDPDVVCSFKVWVPDILQPMSQVFIKEGNFSELYQKTNRKHQSFETIFLVASSLIGFLVSPHQHTQTSPACTSRLDTSIITAKLNIHWEAIKHVEYVYGCSRQHLTLLDVGVVSGEVGKTDQIRCLDCCFGLL